MAVQISAAASKSLRLELDQRSTETKTGSRMATVALPTKSAVCHSCEAKGLSGVLNNGDIVSIWESADGVDLRVYCTGTDRPCQAKPERKVKKTGRKASSRRHFSAKAEKAKAVAALAATLQPKAAPQPKAATQLQAEITAAKAAGARLFIVL